MNTISKIHPISEIDQLESIINDPNLVLLDASDYSKEMAIGKEILTIPGAIYFDLKNVMSDQESALPNMMLSAHDFQSKVRNLGINNNSRIVVFDNQGIYNSPRVWYMFKSMGHNNISCLNGGLPGWIEAKMETKPIKSNMGTSGDFEVTESRFTFRTIDEIIENLKSKDSLVIDARSQGRFNGTAPEPREGLTSGHIPYSINIPYTDVLENGFLKSQDDLMKAFKRKAIEDQELIFSCGSGVTACIILLAATQVVDNQLSVYDGSWTEWASHPKTPIMFTQKS